jgi:hypothetical protein
VDTPRQTVTDLLGSFAENGNSAESGKTTSEDDDSETKPFKLSKSEQAHLLSD